jgi:hypothetical protein
VGDVRAGDVRTGAAGSVVCCGYDSNRFLFASGRAGSAGSVKPDHSRVPASISMRRDFSICIAFVIVGFAEVVSRYGRASFREFTTEFSGQTKRHSEHVERRRRRFAIVL